MNPDLNRDELNHLFSVARHQRMDTSAAEYAFETRLLAQIREKRRSLLPYGMMAWRLIPVFCCAVLVLAFWLHQATLESDQVEQIAVDQNQESISLLGEAD